jgi:hypothetical protein
LLLKTALLFRVKSIISMKKPLRDDKQPES